MRNISCLSQSSQLVRLRSHTINFHRSALALHSLPRPLDLLHHIFLVDPVTPGNAASQVHSKAQYLENPVGSTGQMLSG